MSTPSLTYFNGRGLAESIRLILTYLNIEFQDNRVESITDELRATLPYGQLPVYKDGDFTLAQSASITRYIAAKNNFDGKTFEERATADSINESLWDLLRAIFKARDQPEAEKEKVKAVVLPKFLAIWEKNLEKNQFVAGGDALTYVDLTFFGAIDYLPQLGYEFEGYPKIKEFQARIASIPQIKSYIEKRPVTKF